MPPTHARRRAATASPVLLALLAVVAVGGWASPASATGAYQRPVPGPVLRAFDPGVGPYSPGHRGVDLAAPAGAPVRAAAAGEVAYAGAVAGVRWVSIDHADGVRTSYGPLGRVDVRAGEPVGAGAPIGTATVHDGRDAVHWSARRGRTYLDPLGLLRPDPPWRPALVGPGGWRVTDLPDVPRYEHWDGEHRWGLVPGSRDAEGPGWVLPPNPNHVIVIGGFGSRSGTFGLDPRDLGFDASAVTELSHGGRDPLGGGAPDDPRRDQLPYGAADTLIGIEGLARQLRTQLQAHHAAHPGQAVDLVGHSMGGVVALHYLLTMHDPTDPSLPPIGHVATVGSPLEGADLANLADGVASSLVGELLLRLSGTHTLATSHTTTDLAVGSTLLRELAASWERATADRWAGPLATGTRVLTVGASRDLVVPEHRTDLPGAAHVVVPGGHSSALDTEAARIVLRAFLAGEPPPGEAGGLGHALSYGLGATERAAGYVAPWAEELLLARYLGPLDEAAGLVREAGKTVIRRLPWPG